jgi:hypothetical protein
LLGLEDEFLEVRNAAIGIKIDTYGYSILIDE